MIEKRERPAHRLLGAGYEYVGTKMVQDHAEDFYVLCMDGRGLSESKDVLVYRWAGDEFKVSIGPGPDRIVVRHRGLMINGKRISSELAELDPYLGEAWQLVRDDPKFRPTWERLCVL